MTGPPAAASAQQEPTPEQIAQSAAREKAATAIGTELRRRAASGDDVATQRAYASQALQQEGIPAETADALLTTAVDGIDLRPTAQRAASHLGGKPLAKPGEAWPKNKRSRKPLAVLAVLDLAQLKAPPPLPADGSLVLYYDAAGPEIDGNDAWIDIASNCEVRWIPAGTSARERRTPRKAPAFRRRFVAGTAMPIFGGFEQIDSLPGTQADIDLGYDLVTGLANVAYSGNRLLGASDDLQGPVLEEIPYWFKKSATGKGRRRYSAAERAGKGWTLLAQVTSSGDMTFGDAGNVSFAVPTVDLAARRFDRAVGLLQF